MRKRESPVRPEVAMNDAVVTSGGVEDPLGRVAEFDAHSGRWAIAAQRLPDQPLEMCALLRDEVFRRHPEWNVGGQGGQHENLQHRSLPPCCLASCAAVLNATAAGSEKSCGTKIRFKTSHAISCPLSASRSGAMCPPAAE
jgi:hypothetical protein